MIMFAITFLSYSHHISTILFQQISISLIRFFHFTTFQLELRLSFDIRLPTIQIFILPSNSLIETRDLNNYIY